MAKSNSNIFLLFDKDFKLVCKWKILAIKVKFSNSKSQKMLNNKDAQIHLNIPIFLYSWKLNCRDKDKDKETKDKKILHSKNKNG